MPTHPCSVINGGDNRSMRRVRQLSEERRGSGCDKSSAEADEKPPSNEHAKILCASLHQCTKDDDHGSEKDGMSSSVLIRSEGSKGQRDHATDDLHVHHEPQEAPVRVIEICKSH